MAALAEPFPDAAPERAGRREWLGLAVIALPCLIYSMDLTVLNLAVPSLARDIRPSASELLWIIDIYGFMVAGLLIVMGALGDRLGRRRVLLWGAAFFGAASVLAAFASTPTELILARALLGVAGATIAPSTLSLIAAMFRDEGQRTFAISIWIMAFSVGGLIGPVAGGLLIDRFWWGAVFLVAVPPMILLLILGPLLLPERRAPGGRIDLVSALLSLAGVLALIWGVKRWAAEGLDPAALGALAAGLAVLRLFALRQRRLADPLVDLALFAKPAFALALGINTGSMFFLFGAFIFIAQYLQLVAGLGPLEAGLWSLPSAAAFALASPFTRALEARLGARAMIAGGLAVSAAGFAGLALAPGFLGVVLSGVVVSVGITPVFGLTIGFVVGAAPVEKAGAASALAETGAELGGALGVALLGALMALVYRLAMTDPAFATLAPEARATLAGAVEAARTMAPEAAAPLLAAGRAAFMDAFALAAAVAALAGLSALAARALGAPAKHG